MTPSKLSFEARRSCRTGDLKDHSSLKNYTDEYLYVYSLYIYILCIYTYVYIHTYIHTADSQAGRQAGRQTDRFTDIHACMHTYIARERDTPAHMLMYLLILANLHP